MTPIDSPMQNFLTIANKAAPLIGAASAPATGGLSQLIPLGISLLNNLTSFGMQERTNKQNQELAQQQNQWNIDQWNRANAYNSPAAQMARLKAAGINPHLAYSNGNVQNLGTDSPTAAEVRYDPMQMQMLDPLTLSQVKLNDAQAESLTHDTKRLDEKHPYDLDNLDASTKNIRRMVKHMDAQEKEIFARISDMAFRQNLDQKELDGQLALWNSTIGKQDSEKVLNQQQFYEMLLTFSLRKAGLDLTNKEIQSRINLNSKQVSYYGKLIDLLEQQIKDATENNNYKWSPEHKELMKELEETLKVLQDWQGKYWQKYTENPDWFKDHQEGFSFGVTGVSYNYKN